MQWSLESSEVMVTTVKSQSVNIYRPGFTIYATKAPNNGCSLSCPKPEMSGQLGSKTGSSCVTRVMRSSLGDMPKGGDMKWGT